MPRSPEELLALATRFTLSRDLSIERRGEGKWAVLTSTGSRVTQGLEARWEPMPSSRDDDYERDTLFSLDEAFDLAERYMQAQRRPAPRQEPGLG